MISDFNCQININYDCLFLEIRFYVILNWKQMMVESYLAIKWFWHWLVHIPMFTHFTVKNEDIIVMRQLDYITLQLLVDFIYSRNIIITENNVQVIIDKV